MFCHPLFAPQPVPCHGIPGRRCPAQLRERLVGSQVPLPRKFNVYRPRAGTVQSLDISIPCTCSEHIPQQFTLYRPVIYQRYHAVPLTSKSTPSALITIRKGTCTYYTADCTTNCTSDWSYRSTTRCTRPLHHMHCTAYCTTDCTTDWSYRSTTRCTPSPLPLSDLGGDSLMTSGEMGGRPNSDRPSSARLG